MLVHIGSPRWRDYHPLDEGGGIWWANAVIDLATFATLPHSCTLLTWSFPSGVPPHPTPTPTCTGHNSVYAKGHEFIMTCTFLVFYSSISSGYNVKNLPSCQCIKHRELLVRSDR